MYLKEDGDGGYSIVLIGEEEEESESDELYFCRTSGNTTG